jgi:hypothetical protein
MFGRVRVIATRRLPARRELMAFAQWRSHHVFQITYVKYETMFEPELIDSMLSEWRP